MRKYYKNLEIFSKKGLFFKAFYDKILSVRKIEQNQLKSKVYIFKNIYKRKWSLAGNH